MALVASKFEQRIQLSLAEATIRELREENRTLRYAARLVSDELLRHKVRAALPPDSAVIIRRACDAMTA
jgi:hypothetical protein